VSPRHAVRARRPATRIGLAAVAAALAATALAAAGATASPSIEDERARAAAIIAQIRLLDEEVGAAAERWNGANLELEALTTRLAETRATLKRVRRLYGVSQDRLGARAVELYTGDQPGSDIEVLVGAGSLAEIIDALDAMERIAGQDARIVAEAQDLRARIVAQEQKVGEAREKQATVVARLADEKRTIEGRLSERERLLASVRDEIARLEAAERRRQEELRRRAQAELARQRRVAAEGHEAQEPQAPPAAAASPEPAPAEPSTGASSPPPADASRGAQVVAIAMRYLGVPYRWGGASPSQGFDCSGFTMYVFAQIGVSLPHYAAAQYGLGAAVSKDELQPGDLVFFRGLGHMGMYIGGGSFIHAPRTGDVVKISSLAESYYVANWVGARRVL
jgi:cell wall-associated NlpC family hydrolase